MLLSAPRVFATAYDSIGVQFDKVGDALDEGKGINVAAGVLQIAAVSLPCLGMIFTSGRLGHARRQGGLELVRGRSLPAHRGGRGDRRADRASPRSPGGRTASTGRSSPARRARSQGGLQEPEVAPGRPPEPDARTPGGARRRAHGARAGRGLPQGRCAGRRGVGTERDRKALDGAPPGTKQPTVSGERPRRVRRRAGRLERGGAGSRGGVRGPGGRARARGGGARRGAGADSRVRAGARGTRARPTRTRLSRPRRRQEETP